MEEIEVKFYKKLNEYYQERDHLYTLKSLIGHSYSFVDFLLFFIISSIILLTGIILSIIHQDIIFLDALLLFSLPGYIVTYIIFKDRKKQINKVRNLEKEIRDMIKENKPLFDNKKLTLGDYLEDFKNLGFDVNIIDENNKKIYLIKGSKATLKIISKNTFFINSLKCFINDVNFKKIKNDDVKLNQLIKDYKSDSLDSNYYQMLFYFHKYIIITIENYFN